MKVSYGLFVHSLKFKGEIKAQHKENDFISAYKIMLYAYAYIHARFT